MYKTNVRKLSMSITFMKISNFTVYTTVPKVSEAQFGQRYAHETPGTRVNVPQKFKLDHTQCHAPYQFPLEHLLYIKLGDLIQYLKQFQQNIYLMNMKSLQYQVHRLKKATINSNTLFSARVKLT